MPDSVTVVTEALSGHGIMTVDRVGEHIRIQASPDTWEDIEAIGTEYGWEVVDRSRIQQAVELRPEEE